jgi:hypothetical protein
MARKRIAVLEVHEPLCLSAAQTFCGREIAERLIATYEARRIGKRLIQMVRAKACDAIKQAKAERDSIRKKIQRVVLFDGPTGVGNLLPFSKPHSYGDKLHYSTPMAGDVGMRRYGLYVRRDEHGVPQLQSREIRVSSRSLFTHQALPAVLFAS